MEITKNKAASIHFCLSKEFLSKTLMVRFNDEWCEGKISSSFGPFPIEEDHYEIEVKVKDEPYSPAQAEFSFLASHHYRFVCSLEGSEGKAQIKILITDFHSDLWKEIEDSREATLEKCLERLGGE